MLEKFFFFLVILWVVAITSVCYCEVHYYNWQLEWNHVRVLHCVNYFCKRYTAIQKPTLSGTDEPCLDVECFFHPWLWKSLVTTHSLPCFILSNLLLLLWWVPVGCLYLVIQILWWAVGWFCMMTSWKIGLSVSLIRLRVPIGNFQLSSQRNVDVW